MTHQEGQRPENSRGKMEKVGPREAHSQRASMGCQLKQRVLADGKRQGDMGQETRDLDGEEWEGSWAGAEQ